LFLGLGAFFLLAAVRAWYRSGLSAQVCLMGGFVGARSLSVLVDGAPSPFLVILFAGEAALLGLGLVALRKLREPSAA
jgi:hypothetical protein